MPFVVPMRLEADGLDTLYFNQGTHNVAMLDIGDPATREVVDNAPDANGTIDTSRYFGNRSVTLSVVVRPDSSAGTMWEQRNLLRAFTRPDLRPKLYFQIEDGAPEVVLTLRRSGWSDPWQAPFQRQAVISVQFVCPSGVIESAELHSVTAGAGGEVAQTGLTFDATPDFSFGGATQASGGGVVDNAGNVPVWPTVTMFGPFSAGTVLRNDTTGQELEFVSTMSIVAGDWLRIDFAAKTIVNSAGTSYYDSLDFAASEWWQLAPGENRIYMLPTTFTAPPASMLIEWRSGWL